MKMNLKWTLAGIAMPCSYMVSVTMISVMVSATAVAANERANDQEIYAQLRSQMARACPAVWEALGANMDTESLNESDPWSGNQVDKNEFKALLQETIPGASANDIAAMSDDMATVATECASHRVALLDALISKTPRDVLLAMDAVNRGLNKSIEYLDGGWSTGDVRVTGRLEAQDGWVFLTGQTIGSATSSADLSGDLYFELFELARNWAPNTGTESWEDGHKVTLPDMRGRALFGVNTMNSQPGNTITKDAANKVGGTFGKQTRVLTRNQLPAHTHAVDSQGNHTHATGYDGNHKHTSKQALYGAGNYGAGTFADKWPAGGIRPTSDGGNSATLTHAIYANGNHKHPVAAAGMHQHKVQNTGNSGAVDMLPPAIVFNMEMKY